MKKSNILKLMISIIFFPFLLNAQTEISGGINEDTNWTIENSPYLITDDTVIFGDNTLTIDAGVIVNFEDNVQLRIQGSLIAIGNEDEIITFTSNNLNPQKGSWEEINFEFGATFILEHTLIEYANNALSYNFINTISSIKNTTFQSNNNAIKVDSGRPQFPITINTVKFINNDKGICNFHDEVNLINCEFKNNRIGAEIVESNIESCSFEGNTEIALDGNSSKIRNSTFINNGVALDQTFNSGFFDSEMIDNTITNNNIGVNITGFASDVNISNNTICDNAQYNVINTRSTGANFSNNCWCTDDLNEIENTIQHGLDDITLGIVDFEPIQVDCIDEPVLSLNDFTASENKFIFYPNPVENEIKFFDNDKKEYEIFSITGAQLKKGSVNNNLNVSELKQGIYLIKVSKNESLLTVEKLIKK